MPEPSALRRRLADELRGARTLSGLSQQQMAARIAVSQKTVSRIETADRLPDRAQLSMWLRDVDEDTRRGILVLADAAHVETRPWAQVRDGGHIQGAARADEEVATLARVYCGAFLPGLLQTAEYTRLLAPLVDPGSDVAAMVAARVQRQQVLYDAGKRFEFLLAEPALQYAPDASVRPAQRDRLVSLSTLATVNIRILPARRTGPLGWHDFIVWSAPGVSSWVTVEMRHGGAVVADPDAVADYTLLWSRLWESALSGDDVVRFIRSLP